MFLAETPVASLVLGKQMEWGRNDRECSKVKERTLAKTGRYFGTARWKICPKGCAASSRSTSVKPPALPEVADSALFILTQALLGFTTSNTIPPTSASAPVTGGIKWLTVVSMCIPRNSIGFPGVVKVMPE